MGSSVVPLNRSRDILTCIMSLPPFPSRLHLPLLEVTPRIQRAPQTILYVLLLKALEVESYLKMLLLRLSNFQNRS
jgi:hypothetical protein